MDQKQKQDSTDLDQILSSGQLNEKTELEGVAEQIFKADRTRTKLLNGEVSMVFVTDIVFDCLGMKTQNPTNKFMELKKSENGWSTEKFVQTTQQTNDNRSGGSIGSWFKDRLFTPKQ